MNLTIKRILLLLLAAAVVGSIFGWPRINDVETGKTAQYPDIQPASYSLPPERVFEAAKEIAGTSSGWKLGGHGFGPGSWSVQAVRSPGLLPLVYDVHVKITRQGSQVRVSVRSTSRWGKWDFGQNARNIRVFLRLLDQKLAV